MVKALSSEKCREGRSWEPRLEGTRVTAPPPQEGECPGGSERGGVSGPSLPGVHGKAGVTHLQAEEGTERHEASYHPGKISGGGRTPLCERPDCLIDVHPPAAPNLP